MVLGVCGGGGGGGRGKIISSVRFYAQPSSNTMIPTTFRWCQKLFDSILKAFFLQNFPAFIRKFPCLIKLSSGLNTHVLSFMCLFLLAN